jgi:hypothetical protein
VVIGITGTNVPPFGTPSGPAHRRPACGADVCPERKEDLM